MTLKQFDNTPFFRVQGKKINIIYLLSIFVKDLNILMMYFAYSVQSKTTDPMLTIVNNDSF